MNSNGRENCYLCRSMTVERDKERDREGFCREVRKTGENNTTARVAAV